LLLKKSMSILRGEFAQRFVLLVVVESLFHNLQLEKMKKKILLCLVGIITSLGLSAQSIQLTGKIKHADTDKFLSGVQVNVLGVKSITTNDLGVFQFENLEPGRYLLEIKSESFQTITTPIKLVENKNLDLGILKLFPINNLASEIDIENLADAEMDEAIGDEGISGMLNSRKDPFNSATAYTFSSARFKRRGYGSEESSLYFNGVPMNDMENGRAYWYLWGGLNDVTRNQVVTDGLDPMVEGFGGFGGGANIDTKADTYRPGTKLVYSMSNRSYKNRLMVTHATGMMDNGWAFTFSGSKRWAEEGYIEGTSYDAYGYFMSALKKINDKHSIGLTVFGAPSTRGGSGASVQSAYDILDNNYYNPNWGWQDGKKRNAKMQKTHMPVAILKHYWDVNDKTNIETSVSYKSGKSGRTALNWMNAPDPRPDYYRNLPIYASNYNNPNIAADFKANSQLDWGAMYNANQNNNPTGEARYFLEDRRKDIDQLMVNVLVERDITESLKFRGGVDYNNYVSHNFTTVDDLMGATYVRDIDKFADRNSFDFNNPNMDPDVREGLIHDLIQNDLNNPDRIVKEGDVYGHNYDAHINKISGFAQVEYTTDRVDYYASLKLEQTQMWRESFMRKGLFPDNSYGESEKLNFFDYGVKAGATYKLNAKNYFSVNAGYITKAPTYRSMFLSPRTRHTSLKDIGADESEKIMTIDFGYNHLGQNLKFKANAYYTRFVDQTRTMGFYHDELRSFVNSVQTGIDKTHVGIELGVDYKLTTDLSIIAAAAIGSHVIDSRPELTLISDNENELLVENETIFVKNFKESGYPQQAYTAGLKYSGPHRTWVGVNANYYREMYLSYSPIRRTIDALDYKDVSEELYRKVISQTQLDDQLTMDINIGKSWNIDYKYYVNVNLSINNVLNNTDFITGGYEQSRMKDNMNESDISQFPPKLYYSYGRNFFLNVSFSF